MRDRWTEVGISDLLEVSIGGVWGGDPGTDEIDVCVYRQTEFDDNGKLSMPSDAVRSITKNQLKSRTLQPSDVLMQKSAGTPTLPGRVVIVPSEIERNATCSNFLHLLRADSTRCNSHFLFWFLWFNHQSGKAFEFQRGTNIKNLDLNQYLAQKVLIPPLSEQKRIVDVVSCVDVYIDALQHHAETTSTARNAVLHELLSVGGDDWTETTLGDISNFVSRRELPKGLALDTPYVGLEHVEPKTTLISTWGDVESVSSSVTPFEPEDTLFGRLRPYLHKVAFADFPGVCSPEILVLRSSSNCNPMFLYLLCSLDSTVEKCVDMSAGTRMPRTSTTDLASIPVRLPPIKEQKRIVEIVSSMDDVIRSTEQAVTDAKNLRSGLLSDLLSGNHEIPASYDSMLGAA
jgi:restriction endonuclease S subunit